MAVWELHVGQSGGGHLLVRGDGGNLSPYRIPLKCLSVAQRPRDGLKARNVVRAQPHRPGTVVPEGSGPHHEPHDEAVARPNDVTDSRCYYEEATATTVPMVRRILSPGYRREDQDEPPVDHALCNLHGRPSPSALQRAAVAVWARRPVGGFWRIQPFSQKSRTPTVAKEFQIGLCGVCGVVEAGLELFCNCWSAGFLGERLYVWNLAEVTRLYLSGWPKLKCVRTRENMCCISICRPADFQIDPRTRSYWLQER